MATQAKLLVADLRFCLSLRIVNRVDEAVKLMEVGYEFHAEVEGHKLFRKRNVIYGLYQNSIQNSGDYLASIVLHEFKSFKPILFTPINRFMRVARYSLR